MANNPLDPSKLIDLLMKGDASKLAAYAGISISQAKAKIRAFSANRPSLDIISGPSGTSMGTATLGWLEKTFGGIVNSLTGGLKLFTSGIGNAVGNFSDNLKGSIDEQLGSVTDFASLLAKSAGRFDVMGVVAGSINKATEVLTTAVSNVYKAETEARDIVNKRLNVAGELATEFRDTMLNAYEQTKLFGATFEDIKTITEGISTNLGRVQLLNSTTLNDIYTIQQTLGLSNTAISEAAGAFEDVSIGIGDVSKQIEKSGTYARSVGLKVNDYVAKLTANLKLMNTYGFKNGIDGLQKMVAQATALRLEISKVTDLAEKVINPEGAIEMAAKLNAIGAGFGSFTDPLKMVYQSTNDIGGLQDSLVEAAKALTHFNTESGRFEISATNMRKARDMAEALGMSAQELTDLGIRAAQRMEAMSKIDMLGSFDEKQKEFLSNMASMKDGRIQIQLPDGLKDKFGDAAKDGFLDVANMNSKQVDELKKVMDQYDKDVNKKPQELMMEQISELQAIENLVASIATNIGVRANRSDVAKNMKREIRLIANDPEKAKTLKDEASTALADMATKFGEIIENPKKAVDMLTGAVERLKNLVDGWRSGSVSTTSQTAIQTVKAVADKGGSVKTVPDDPNTAPTPAPNFTPGSVKIVPDPVDLPQQPQQSSVKTVPQPPTAIPAVKEGKDDSLNVKVVPDSPDTPVVKNVTQVIQGKDDQSVANVPIVQDNTTNVKVVPDSPDTPVKPDAPVSQTPDPVQPVAKDVTNVQNTETKIIERKVEQVQIPERPKAEVPKVSDIIPKKVEPVKFFKEGSTSQTAPEKSAPASNSTSQTIKTDNKKIDVTLNIKSDQTIYDNIARSMLNDTAFISMLKDKIKELDFD